MRILSVLILLALLMLTACGNDEPVAKSEKKEHFLSAQQKALEKAKAVAGAANDAMEKRQKELDKLNDK